MNKPKRWEQTLGFIVLSLLLIGCFVVMQPFLSAAMWAVVLGYTLWPVHSRLLDLLGQRRTLAACLTTLSIGLVMVVPFVVIGFSVADDARALGSATRAWFEKGAPAPPAWVEKVPIVGKQAKLTWKETADDVNRLVEQWKTANEDTETTHTNLPATSPGMESVPTQPAPPQAAPTPEFRIISTLKRAVNAVRNQVVAAGLALGRGVMEVALSVFLVFFIFRDGAAVADRLNVAVLRIAGEQGKRLLLVAGNTVRGVVYGILGTALAQGVTAGIGFVIAGVPGAALLGLLTFILSVLPMGPPLVWIPAVIWLYQKGAVGWAIFMLVWGIGVSSLDNIVKPWLISQGSDLPFVLIFLGVIGGALAFGLIGVFLGPTLLAVAFRVVADWSSNPVPPPTDDAAPAGVE